MTRTHSQHHHQRDARPRHCRGSRRGPPGPIPASSTTTCMTKIVSVTGTVATCSATYTYAAHAARDLIDGARAKATVTVIGKTDVVGTGRIRHHQLVIAFSHLRRRRYRLTQIELQHD